MIYPPCAYFAKWQHRHEEEQLHALTPYQHFKEILGQFLWRIKMMK